MRANMIVFAKLHVSKNINWRLCLVNYTNRFPPILTFLWVRSASLQFATVKDIRGSDWQAVLCPFFYLSASRPQSSSPLISWPLSIFLYFIFSALFLLLLLTSILPHLPHCLYFSSSPSHLPSSCFSYHSASHPRGDRIVDLQYCWEQGFKKKQRHDLYYQRLLSSSKRCTQWPSFCVTLMWLVGYDSYCRICSLITKVNFFQLSEDGPCLRRTSEKDFLSLFF